MQPKAELQYLWSLSTDTDLYSWTPVRGVDGKASVVIYDPGTDLPVSIEAMDDGSILSDPALAFLTKSALFAYDLSNPDAPVSISAYFIGSDLDTSAGTPRALNTNSVLYAYNLDLDDNTYSSATLSAANATVDGATVFALHSLGFNYAFDGTTWQAARTGSAANLSASNTPSPLLVTAPGEWSINHTPTSNTQATISKAAGAAGVCHVCRSITATITAISTAAADTTVLVNLRDGATGAGTILWSTRLLVKVGDTVGIALSNLNIPGTAATAMTLEFAAAGGANTFEAVALTGFDAA